MPNTSEIRLHGSVPTLFIDGKPAVSAAYMCYLDERARYKDFADAGYKMFTFPCCFARRTINVLTDIAPFRKGIYDREGDPDFSEVDRELKQITDICPDALIFPRVNIAMPQWWEEKNPSELNRLDNGLSPATFPVCRESFSSVLWRNTADRMLVELIDHLEATPYASNIVGYHIASGGTEEWFHFGSPRGGMGECAESGYLRFLSEKYPDDTGLIKTLPSFSLYENGEKRITDINIIRFLEYTNYIVADSIFHFCATVKNRIDRRLVVGSFYGYILELTDARFGSHALSRVLRCPDIDFISSPSSYINGRTPGMDQANMTVLDSVKLHGKLYFTENDMRTYLTLPLAQCRPDACKEGTYIGGVWKGPDDPEVSLWMLRSCFARNLTHGIGQWWFDMWGGWYSDSVFMSEFHSYLDIAEKAMNDHHRDSVSEVAVVVSEESYRYTNPCHPSVSHQNYCNRLPLGAVGAPYDVYDLNDIDSLPPRIKMTVFLNIAGREGIALRYCYDHPEKKYVFTDSEGTDTPGIHNTGDLLTTEMLRGFYKEAGIHIYTDTDDVVHVCENYIAVHAASSGVKSIRLKENSVIIPLLPHGSAFTGHTIITEMRQYETKLFRKDRELHKKRK